MQQWFDEEGERHLLEAESVEDSGERMEQILNSFTGFLIEANVSVTCPVTLRPVLVSDCPSRPGPETPRHEPGVGGRAAPAERDVLSRGRETEGVCEQF